MTNWVDWAVKPQHKQNLQMVLLFTITDGVTTCDDDDEEEEEEEKDNDLMPAKKIGPD